MQRTSLWRSQRWLLRERWLPRLAQWWRGSCRAHSMCTGCKIALTDFDGSNRAAAGVAANSSSALAHSNSLACVSPLLRMYSVSFPPPSSVSPTPPPTFSSRECCSPSCWATRGDTSSTSSLHCTAPHSYDDTQTGRDRRRASRRADSYCALDSGLSCDGSFDSPVCCRCCHCSRVVLSSHQQGFWAIQTFRESTRPVKTQKFH